MKAALASTLVGLIAVAMSINADCAAQCGPFGNAPAEINHGGYASFVSSHNPICWGGIVLGPFTDADGTQRNACLYEPASAGKENPLPLIIFLHGSIATADSIRLTGLFGLVDKADLGEQKPGFILLAPEGRYTSHFYPGLDSNGLGWDNWYRQLNPAGDVTVAGAVYHENQDAAAIDHFVTDIVASGKVDRNRIYVMGWSNGAAMAMLYALNRPWIAAAAVYSAPDPFAAFTDPCPQRPVATAPNGVGQLQLFNPHVPIMHVRNNCDIGGICPNGSRFANRMHTMGDSVDDIILDPSDKQVTSCDDACGTNEMGDGKVTSIGSLRGAAHHLRWPADWNPSMLAFLKRHPLSSVAPHVVGHP
jgi:predicted esterase